MTRRLRGPLGGAVTFLIVAGLVIGGLGWVTVAALRVEAAQREAAAQADLGNNLRVALWRLDGGMFPLLGLEDSRPYDHYTAAHSPFSALTANDRDAAAVAMVCVPSPLITAKLPEWMLLHFQIDPRTGWESPQVPSDVATRGLRQSWSDFSVTPATSERAKLLESLRAQYSVAEVTAVLAARESALPSDSPPFAVPPLLIDVGPQLGNPDISAPAGVPGPAATEAKAPEPPASPRAVAAAPAGKSPEAVLAQFFTGNPGPKTVGTIRIWGLEFCPAGEGTATANAPKSPLPYSEPVVGPPAPTSARLSQAAPPPRPAPPAFAANNFSQNGTLQGGYRSPRQGQERINEYTTRAQIMVQSMAEQKYAYENSFHLKNNSVANGMNQVNPAATIAQAPVPPPLIVSGTIQAGPGFTPALGGTFSNPNTMTATAPAAGSMGLPVPALKPKFEDSQVEKKATDLGTISNGGATAAIRTPTAIAKDMSKKPAGREESESLKTGDFEKARKESGKSQPLPTEPVAPPVLAGPPATVPLVLQPPVTEADLVKAPPAPAVVHLGAMRTHWLRGADGIERLALVRTARLDNRVVYQGVLLDWDRLRAELLEKVNDLFPQASLIPFRDPATVSPERAMTALPVQLDPGPSAVPPVPPWTPLRFGLVLAWAAALIALAAVGLGGWSLIDLSERRIRFVSAVTHELRTPLTSLRLYLDLLTSGMVTDETKRAEYLTTLNAESDRLHRLIDNVLDFARLENRSRKADRKAVTVAELLESVRQTWQGRCSADGRELIVISTLPPDRLVTTDPHLVQQIVGNLIDNAKKYAREAEDKRIWLWARPTSGSRIAFEVEDRGPGVPARERARVFRPFRRGSAADTTAGGAGLGLALARQWAEALRGRLTYRQADGGVGACFHLELPGT